MIKKKIKIEKKLERSGFRLKLPILLI